MSIVIGNFQYEVWNNDELEIEIPQMECYTKSHKNGIQLRLNADQIYQFEFMISEAKRKLDLK